MNEIVPMTDEAIRKVYEMEAIVLTMPQVHIDTNHIFHAGMYARTIMIPANTILTGALIKIATLLIMQGDVTVYIGGESVDYIGYNILKGGANRKQAFFARTDTMLTMIFPTEAKTIENAENEFTNEADMLITRRKLGA
jgi:hypothetical protein